MLLDEVGDIPTDLQVKLLRVLEHRAVTPVGDARPRPTDIRLIAATNRPLDRLMAAGRFREDLFFRLSVFPIHIAPLRERREDIPALAEHFLGRSRPAGIADLRLGDELLAELRSRPWIGNIRELRNAIEHAAIVARGQLIRPEHLPPAMVRAEELPISSGVDLPGWLVEWARREIQSPRSSPADASLYERFLELIEPPLLEAVLGACQHNRAAAAEILGIHRATLRQKLRKYGMADRPNS